jgi:hypothetical protein
MIPIAFDDIPVSGCTWNVPSTKNWNYHNSMCSPHADICLGLNPRSLIWENWFLQSSSLTHHFMLSFPCSTIHSQHLTTCQGAYISHSCQDNNLQKQLCFMWDNSAETIISIREWWKHGTDMQRAYHAPKPSMPRKRSSKPWLGNNFWVSWAP